MSPRGYSGACRCSCEGHSPSLAPIRWLRRGPAQECCALLSRFARTFVPADKSGRTVQYTVLEARELDDRVIVAHVRGNLSVPAGPLAGEAEALASIVLVRDGDDHQIAAFHNTLLAPV